ncbi:MAG: cytochrome c3 family protein [Rhodocyclales bacterium]|nr:cytochrome c3 family protein [Rhodocyclales bacterium]
MRRHPILQSFLLLAACVAGTASADIRTTPHSLVRKSVKADASDICVFCHTPNLSGAPPDKAPLWQGSIGTDLVFTIYDDIGRLGLGKSSVGSQSIACLSCHDANQARAVSKTSADHPFGVPYRGATKSRPPAIPALGRKPDFNPENPAIWARNLVAHEDLRDVSQGIIEERTVWWVSMSGTTARRMRNDLPLYTRNETDSGQDMPFIECSSCHDPHSNNSKFLRLTNDGSRLCLTCHIK